MKKIAFFTLLVILLAGCTGGGSESLGSWTMNINSYKLENAIYSSLFGEIEADDGFMWLVFDVTVTNNKQEQSVLIFSVPGNDLEFLADSGNKYSFTELFWRADGHLPEIYKPQQTLSGIIYVQVHAGVDPQKGTLVFKHTENPKNAIFDLAK